MKKKILLTSILTILLLTGCNANYSLEINDETIKETFSVIENNLKYANIEDDFQKTFYDYSKLYGEELDIETDYNALYCDGECSEDCDVYDKELIDDGSRIGFKLEHYFSFEDYSKSSIATEIIPGFSAHYDGKFLIISGGSTWNFLDDYQHLEEVNISIKTNYRVDATNLKKESAGNYVWTVKNDGENQERLFIRIDTTKVVDNQTKNNDFLILAIIVLGGLFVVLLGYLYFNKKK